VTICFFGDGANNEGAFHEALNMAAVWKLPVVFVCENNKYGMSTSIERSTAVKRISERAAAYAMPGVTVDGNDFSAVTEAVDQAVAHARAGDGPRLVENLTYRWRGHSKSDRNRYRTKEEIADWQSRDPIAAMARLLMDHRIATEADITSIEAEAASIIENAIAAAAAAPDPKVEEATRDVYTPQLESEGTPA
jgi:pyruvate dehydrogenase E1 component alpha subunit